MCQHVPVQKELKAFVVPTLMEQQFDGSYLTQRWRLKLLASLDVTNINSSLFVDVRSFIRELAILNTDHYRFSYVLPGFFFPLSLSQRTEPHDFLVLVWRTWIKSSDNYCPKFSYPSFRVKIPVIYR